MTGANPTGQGVRARYKDLLEHVPVGVYRTTASGTIIECNLALAEMLGYDSVSELRKRNAADFYVRASDRQAFLSDMNARVAQPQQYELRRRDGQVIFVRDYARAVFDGAGHVQYYDGIILDITIQKKTEDALRDSEREYRELFENAHDAIMIFSVDKEVILDVNQRACDLYGFSRAEFIGMSLESISRDVSLGKTRIRKTIEETSYHNFETVHFRKNGEEMVMEVNAAVVGYHGVQSILSINRDITERKKMEERIRQLAFHDPLTGLPNRKLLLDRLQLALAQSDRNKRKSALLFLDLDGFKTVNDEHGHDVGDRLLVEIAAALTHVLRRGDTVARLGGDEFVVLIPEVRSEKSLTQVARKIVERVCEVSVPPRTKLRVTTSVGIAVYPRDGGSAQDLLKKADDALYRAKTAGKNRFEFFSRGGGRR
jgi:diguanylate cyclase (GGDEF)-like protein/PAS domain S-box-containing protein